MAYKGSILVTGGTTGIGYFWSLELARRYADHIVIIASRTNKGNAATTINRKLSQSNVTFQSLDLSSLSNVRIFHKTWTAANHPPIKILVLNAGIGNDGPPKFTTDGIESVFGVNHVGHALLFHLLAGQLAPKCRIVITSSALHDSKITFGGSLPAEYISAEALAHPDTNSEVVQGGKARYATSKLVNMLWMFALQRRLDQYMSEATVVAVHPGLVPGTELARDASAVQRFVFRAVLPKLVPVLRLAVPDVRTADQAGKLLCKVSATEGRELDKGATYYSGDKVAEASADARNVEKQEDLWNWTVRFVASSEEEKKKFDALQ